MQPDEVLARLPDGYHALFQRVVETCQQDERVRAMWLGGSLARGDADQSSDLDVLIAVADDAFDEFAAGWRAWLDSITPTVIARALPFLPGSLYSVTPTMERLDIISERVSEVATTLHRVRLLAMDKDECNRLVPAVSPVPGPSAPTIASLIEEFFRDYAMFHTVVDREDWLLGVEAINVIRGLLYRLFLESNAPLPVTGVKRWSEKLTREQRAVLESLPVAPPRRDEVILVHEAVSRAFVVNARDICECLAVEWPTVLDDCVCDYLASRGLPHLANRDPC
jgi:hypothetical protein